MYLLWGGLMYLLGGGGTQRGRRDEDTQRAVSERALHRQLGGAQQACVVHPHPGGARLG